LQISADFETALFIQFLRQAQISILEIFYIFLWLKFSPSLNLNKNYHFSKVSPYVVIYSITVRDLKPRLFCFPKAGSYTYLASKIEQSLKKEECP